MTPLLIRLGFVAQLVLVVILLGRHLSSDNPPVAFLRMDSAIAAGLPLIPETGAPIARAFAMQWRPDARLVAITLRLDWTNANTSMPATDLPERGWIIYLFASGDRTLSLYLDRGTGLLIGSQESPFGSDDWPELLLTTYPRSSAIAAITANLTLGADFRNECPAQRETALVTPSFLIATGGEAVQRPVWVVTWADEQSTNSFDVLFRMDATEGDVVTSETRAVSCAG